MACGAKGPVPTSSCDCCVPAETAPVKIEVPQGSEKFMEIEDQCCAGADVALCKGGSDNKKAADGCAGDCADDCADGCADERPLKPLSKTSDCTDGCCAPISSPPPAASAQKPSCCEGGGGGCCDETCLDRLAQRECNENCEEDFKAVPVNSSSTHRESHKSVSSSSSGKKACSKHKRNIQERYGAILDIFGCICKELLAINEESCCSTSKKHGKAKRYSAARDRESESCSVHNEVSTTGASTPRQPCYNGKGVKKRSRAMKASCSSPGNAIESGSTCATKPTKTQLKQRVVNKTVPTSCEIDLETGLPASEHAAISISGMTCTGCETKLHRTLASVQAITNLQTSLVLSRAEFDFDPRVSPLTDIVKHLERTTEFTCEVLRSQESYIEVLPSINVNQFSQLRMPSGVTSIEVVSKDTVRIFFDAKLTGARDLLRDGFQHEIKLAPQRPHASLEAGQKHSRNLGFMTLLSTFLTIPVLILAWAPLKKKPVLFSSISLALATIVQVIIAGPFYPKALKALVFSRVIEMDLLIVLSTSAAYVFSVVSYTYLMTNQPLSTGEFFETSTLLVTLIMVGRFISALARQRTIESISVRSLQIPTALLVSKEGVPTEEIDARLLQYGDFFQVPPESRIPTDGTVISGSTEIDESMVTGESQPVEKQPGSVVIAGAVNGPGHIVVRLDRLPQENSISAIADMVDESKLSKPKAQELADKVASYFVPVVVGLTTITFILWIVIGITVRSQSGSEAAIQAVTYAITVLIVSCPCAIGLAVPMVIVIAGGVAADHGVIFKSASAIETAYKTSHIIFDKTGTLTQGQMSVVQAKYPSNKKHDLSSLALGLVGNSKHPVSLAVTKYLKGQGVSPIFVDDIKTIAGSGLEGTSSSISIRGGNARWLGLESESTVQSLLSQRYTVFCIVIGTQLYAVFALQDTLRPDSAAVVAELLKRNKYVSIVSGDDEGAVRRVAQQLGITEFQAKCSPAGKRDYIKQIMEVEENVTLFCGDGTNDAVALAQASIGVHVNEGTDVAQSAADVILMRPSLNGIVFLMDLSKASMRRVRFNFGWSFVYNLFAILLAAGAFVNARIPPKFAGLGELVSVLPVIVIALQLRWSEISKV